MLKLHLGCGPHIKQGWTNLDLNPGPGGIKHDLTKRLPFADGSASVIFSEHFIEHIEREQAIRFLRDCHRVLKAHGVLRVTTPDLNSLLTDYHDGKIDRFKDVWNPSTPCQMLNEGLRLWGHKFVYDLKELCLIFRESGFQAIFLQTPQTSLSRDDLPFEVRPYNNEIILEGLK